MFITLVTVFCLGGICNKTFQKVTINTAQIIEVSDYKYYWRDDGITDGDGSFIPHKGVTKMNGCSITIKDKQFPYFTEFPCDDYVRPKLK